GSTQTASIRCTDGIGEDPGGHQVKQHIGRVHDERTQDQLPPVFAENVFQRGLDALIFLDSALENRGFFKRNTDPEPDGYHDDRRQERYAPDPVNKNVVIAVLGRIVSESQRQDEEETVGQQETKRSTQLWPHGRGGSLTWFGGFGDQQSRPRPFATEPKTLAEAHDRQHSWRPQTNLVERWQQTNDEGCNTHGQQRTD